MRFVSKEVEGYRIFAVTGVNTVSFAVDYQNADTKGLLGFAVERYDPTENQRYFVYGMKVFASVIPQPDEKTVVTTYDHPVQSFVWDDFTAKPDRRYEYFFYPLKGKPKNIDRSAPPVKIVVRTEPLFTELEHDIFFNRGVASSQAYQRRFGNEKPDDLQPAEKRLEALQWLSRDLDEALFRFIDQAQAGDTLLGCFYEFRYLPVAERLKAAIDRGVVVKLILDAKINEHTDGKGKFHPSFPREDNKAMVKDAGLPATAIVRWRENNPNNIQHNKFMVLLKGAAQKPAEVWTGSTNMSPGGIHGQTNVGHWVRNADVAAAFESYWKTLENDPGAVEGETRAISDAKRKAYRDAVMGLAPIPADWENIAKGVSSVFSPRSGSKVLDMYVDALDSSTDYGGITLAFGIGKKFKTALVDNTEAEMPQRPVIFLLLEKQDKPNPRASDPFVPLNAKHNVYQAWGSFLRDPVYQWTRETNARALGLNQHVAYVHSKFLLKDPLGADPIVVSGSANFSEASTNDNDENMLLIRGSERVADIYFTEFNRLFNHYYFRSIQEVMAGRSDGQANASADTSASLFLDESETQEWLKKYKPGTLRWKRVQVFTKMAGAKTL
ncbi:phospholipase D-like domain-containing protein [Rhizobium mongolense]|uniref:phospholipase D-like domain-containing protein n=1 Tax=Rhizobium mongolense TaxID=57676 RepID=UPI0035573FAA